MSKGTKVRTVRIDDGLWSRAQEVAKANGDNLSDIIRKALAQYVEDNQEEQP